LKSGSLNLLEPSWPVQACNGIALPFYNPGKLSKKNVNYLLFTTTAKRSVPLFFGVLERDHWGDLGVDGWIILG